MINNANKIRLRFIRVKERAHPSYRTMIEDWLERFEREQEFRRHHLARFERGAPNPWVFDDGSGPLNACVAAIVTASRAGILPADLSRERTLLTSRFEAYEMGLRRRLLHH